MASIVQKVNDGGGTAYIEYYATASYTRSGNTVTITVKCSVYGWGKYYQAFLNGSLVIDSQDTTVYKTFTYNDASAKTYSFAMKAYLQTATSYSGYEYTETLSIDVPAASSPITSVTSEGADHIVAHGISAQADGAGTWYWRKWASGVAECWGILTLSRNVSSAWGTSYDSSEACLAYFPFAFAEVPICLIENCSPGLPATMSIERDSTTTTSAEFRPIRPNAIGSREWKFGVRCIGRYK